MFLFRCCLRVDCSCQSESETEASRSSHSSYDYLRQSEKQIQCRLLPQPVDPASTKHFADYSGCSHTAASRSLLVGSIQSVDYEEVLLVSVASGKQHEESIYTEVNNSVICKPPCSAGIVNNNFSPDTTSSNNNLLNLEPNHKVKLKDDGGPQSASDDNGSASSATSSVGDSNSAEVKYIADIKQFRPMHTSIQPHREECRCHSCQNVAELFDKTEDNPLIHHSSDFTCSCKSCRDFYNRMQCTDATAGFVSKVGGDGYGYSNQYGLISRIAQNGRDIPLTWPQFSSRLSAVNKTAERESFDSQSIVPVHEDDSVSVTLSDTVPGVSAAEEVDEDNGLFSSDDELHYVFHKFIDQSYLEKPFTDVLADERLKPSKAVPSESGTEPEYTSARSADDLEVAYFMVGKVSPASPSALFPDVSYINDASATNLASVSVSCESKSFLSPDTVTSAVGFTGQPFSFVSAPSAYSGRESLSDVDSGLEQCRLNVVSRDVENDNSASSFITSTFGISGGSLASKTLSDAVEIETNEMEANFVMDLATATDDDENQWTCTLSDDGEVRRDVIVQKLSDSSSFFIELPALHDEHVYDVLYSNNKNIELLTPMDADDTLVEQECAPAEEDAVIGQSLEIVTPECIIEHPVSLDTEKASSQIADDGNNEQQTANVASYICDIVASAVHKVAEDAGSLSLGICNVTSENDISADWSNQILITNAPLLSSCHQLATEDERECNYVRTAGVHVLDTDNRRSIETMCVTGFETQEVPAVETYLISYDVHQTEQLNDVDPDVDETLMQSYDSILAEENIVADLVKSEDLIRPLELTESEGEQDFVVAVGENLQSVANLAGCQDASNAGFPPTDIVEDFFMQYVLPVDNVGYSAEVDTTGRHGQQLEDVADHSKLNEDDKVSFQAKQLENTNQNVPDVFSDVLLSETFVDVDTEAAATSALFGLLYKDASDQEKLGLDQEDDRIEKLESAAETIVDAIISDAIAETDADVTRTGNLESPPSASGYDTRPLVPAMSSCMLLSPSESYHKKSVSFADMHGLQLETIQHYEQSPKSEETSSSLDEFLSRLSAAAAERRAKWTEHHPSRIGSWLCNSSVYLLACFELPSSQEELLERVRLCRVAMESCSFDDLALAISGIVRVANIAFDKMVLVRYTVDHWTTQTDIHGDYIPRSNDGPTDRFSFTIILPSRKQFVVGCEAEFAICYVAGERPSFEFWDNNHGRNYVVRCCAKAATSDIRSADIIVANYSNDIEDSA